MVVFNNQIVIEYDTSIKFNSHTGKETLIPKLYRIISWKKSPDGQLHWKEIRCPQNTFESMKGYYEAMSVPVVFYNKDKGTMENSIPDSVNL